MSHRRAEIRKRKFSPNVAGTPEVGRNYALAKMIAAIRTDIFGPK